ncbi:hypothetical protein BCR43DRAFT_486399 [Syncephalastrum racemosum]|uniref:NodB homology domain-containing protein n=1 Tax=Syncephalastrum racemosum TaxID=13706 RepID=A0A1X2HP03_SYNRA|nr:hypothetical protein BCR43DRAFT_486399 [Syncephalastrum racemosum]
MHITLTSALMMVAGQLAYAQSSASSSAAPSGTSSGVLSVASPTWLANIKGPSSGVVTSYPTGNYDSGATLSTATLNLSSYPEPWGSPTTTGAEIEAVINSIDWSHVPNATVQKADKDGNVVMDDSYDAGKDAYCWWSDTNCVTPKASYLPEDIYYCPRAGDWGLTYDDGPFNPTDDNATNKYSEPELYNFLLKQNNQKATLFYIGSNVVTYPAAAVRALNDGLTLCVHTWSHPAMTTQSNEKVVAELYWTLRAIKEATGVTPKCWRPPYGDVDDRVRAIAWQMGMRTIIWDEDTNDWNMPGDGGGNLSPETVDGYFEGWISARQNGSDNAHGHIVLEHELNNSTVSMTEKWLPKLQETFNVVTVHECMNISQPYWETNFVYPTEANNSTTTSSSVSSSAAASTGASASSGGASGDAASSSDSSSSASSDTSAASAFLPTLTGAVAALVISAFALA